MGKVGSVSGNRRSEGVTKEEKIINSKVKCGENLNIREITSKRFSILIGLRIKTTAAA